MIVTLSIIIPVYNAHAYLRHCVESIMALEMTEYEVLLIDDGSTDGSELLCDQMAETCPSVKVIHQSNQGVSVARNMGLKHAEGQWLWFVDADDRVETLPLAQPLDKALEASDAIFATMGFAWEEKGRVDRFTASVGEVPYNLWRCCFRRSEVMRHGLRFMPGRKYAEDQEFILSYLLCTHAISRAFALTLALETPIYYYTLRPGSAMMRQGMKGKKMQDMMAVISRFSIDAVASRQIGKRWMWLEIKRMLKALWVTFTDK